MNRMIASSIAVALSCAPAFTFAQDRPADQQKNQSQSDASAAATGGERAEQARGEAGSNTPASAGQSSDASASGSSSSSGAAGGQSSGTSGANRSSGASDAVGASASDAPSRNSTDLAQPAAAREPAAAADAAAAMQDPTKMFIMESYNSNVFEIQSSQMASQKVQDDKVKQHARMMIEDHTQANQQLKQVAQSMQVQLPTQLDAVHQAKLQKMQQIPASELGRKYMNSQVASHWMSVLEFRYQAKNAQNPQVKQFASQMLPKLEQHLQHAQQMAEQHAGSAQARTASDRQSGDSSSEKPGHHEKSSTPGASGAGGTGEANDSGPDAASR